MEKKKVLPVVRLELNSGVFRIKTEEAVYEITVHSQSSIAGIVEDVVKEERRTAEIITGDKKDKSALPKTEETEARKPEVAEKQEIKEEDSNKKQEEPVAEHLSDAELNQQAIYREITEEMFNEIGRLARQLSLSIKGLPEAFDNKMDIEQAGLDIENAKSMLENVVTMTEKATMEIMDISENINGNCDEIKQNLEQIKKLHFVENSEEQEVEERDSSCDLIVDEILENEARLKEIIKQNSHPEKSPAKETVTAKPQTVTKTIYKFDIDVVFQTLYELCTNETVKKSHIKPMREDIGSQFDVDEIQNAFSDLAPETESEDGFFNFNISTVLKILFQFSNNEKNKQVLKKMNQSSESIFLDQVLPIEGKEEQIEEVVQEEETLIDAETQKEEGTPGTEADGIIDANMQKLKKLADIMKQGVGSAHPTPGYSMVKKDDHKALVSALESTDSVIQKIIENIKRILETLTFQDLSGQKILKIVDTLSFVQVQLLGILVSFGAKLKKIQKDDEDISWDEKENVEDEFNKLISAGKADEESKTGPLDQSSVDKLLAELGF